MIWRKCSGAARFTARQEITMVRQFRSGIRPLAHALALVLCAALPAWAAPADLSAAQRAWVARQAALRFAPEKDYGPFIYVDGEGNPLGLSMDFLRLIGAKTGLRFTVMEALNLDQNLALAKSGAVDLLSSLRPTPERARFLGFTTAYVSIPAALIERAGAPASSLADMGGRRVALGKGYAVEAYARERYPTVTWVALPNDEEALAELRAGRVDAAVADLASLRFISGRRGWNDLRVVEQLGFDYTLSFAYRKDSPELGAVLQRGLQAISAREKNVILARWLPPLAGTWQNRPLAPMAGVAALLLLAAGLAAWSRRRRGDGQG
ncbi:MAG TPA: histidine kinase [Janthinobacterium sp.]|nr:histidine kinase [Janthinobacterium sp.]